MPTDLILRRPREGEEGELLRAHRATSPGYPTFLHYYEEEMDFRRYLEVLEERARGVNLPPSHVPTTFLFAFAGPRIVGRVSIRHHLNDALEKHGGHLGYVVVPEFRRRGYATRILAMAVRMAREALGLSRVLLTVADDNAASIRVIEKNGGVFERTATLEDSGRVIRRYWIDTLHSTGDGR